MTTPPFSSIEGVADLGPRAILMSDNPRSSPVSTPSGSRSSSRLIHDDPDEHNRYLEVTATGTSHGSASAAGGVT